MVITFASRNWEPMCEMNTTPLIDVLLVLLIVLMMSVPIATHSLDIPLPGKTPPGPIPEFNPIRNKVVLTAEGQILWNADTVSPGQLLAVLRQTKRYRVEPELQYEPEAAASYDLSARVLNIIKGSGVTRFGFVGNERYRTFGKD